MYCINDKQFSCSTSLTMNYIGGKWKAAILIHLIEKKKIQGIAQTISHGNRKNHQLATQRIRKRRLD